MHDNKFLSNNLSFKKLLLQTLLCLHTVDAFLPPTSAVEVIESVPSVCVFVCVSVCQHSNSGTRTDRKFDMYVKLDHI